jgi:hypothetical protein
MYLTKRIRDRRPFVGVLDEVVMDCYKPGENRSISEVWRIYKENYKNLAYKTQKVLNHKGIFFSG